MPHKCRWVPLQALATYLGIAPSTASEWARLGRLRACRVQGAHYADGRPRRTSRGKWRVYEADLRAFLTRYRGRPVPLPDSIWRK